MAGTGGKRPGAGRKKGKVSEVKKKAQALALPYAEKAINILAEIMTSEHRKIKESDRISAAKEILDRAYGKAPQAITGEDGGPVGVIFEVIRKQ